MRPLKKEWGHERILFYIKVKKRTEIQKQNCFPNPNAHFKKQKKHKTGEL